MRQHVLQEVFKSRFSFVSGNRIISVKLVHENISKLYRALDLGGSLPNAQMGEFDSPVCGMFLAPNDIVICPKYIWEICTDSGKPDRYREELAITLGHELKHFLQQKRGRFLEPLCCAVSASVAAFGGFFGKSGKGAAKISPFRLVLGGLAVFTAMWATERATHFLHEHSAESFGQKLAASNFRGLLLECFDVRIT